MRLLLVEDDQMLGQALKTGLTQSGYTVDWLANGESAVKALRTDVFDLMVLDIGLPGMSGVEVLHGIRREQNQMPVMVLTAYDAIEDRVIGLDAGADDYLVKPFDLDELLARLRAITRRKGGHLSSEIRVGQIILDTAAHTLVINGKEMPVSNKEYQLLEYLMTRPGQVIQRSHLESILYGWDGKIESNSLEVYIHNLRKKIGAENIATVRGVGYRFVKD